jgi:hypothetical protein
MHSFSKDLCTASLTANEHILQEGDRRFDRSNLRPGNPILDTT